MKNPGAQATGTGHSREALRSAQGEEYRGEIRVNLDNGRTAQA